jgi:hypothetical protein
VLTETSPPKSISKRGYIVSATFDHLVFIWPPLWFFALAWLIVVAGMADFSITLGDPAADGLHIALFPTFALTFTMAHVVAVIFRSHLNRQIFNCYPYRFVAVPIAFILLFSVSQTAWLVGLVLITWTDTWHSSQQTFGFGRLYDMRAGNDAEAGRRLDVYMATLIYIGPILAGVSLATHLGDMSRLDEVGLDSLARFPGWAVANQAWLTAPILILGILFVGYYIYAYWRLAQNGYRVSTQKVLLYLVLAVTSIYTWAFDSFGQSFLIMESFHSLQYFGLVWWAERHHMQKTFRLTHVEAGKGLTLAIFLALCVAFGLWTSLFATTRFEFVLFGVVELMHYWYDGFIWSVRRRQVA